MICSVKAFLVGVMGGMGVCVGIVWLDEGGKGKKGWGFWFWWLFISVCLLGMIARI